MPPVVPLRALPVPGDVVAGRYRIDELLGEGGMGAVFRATQLGLLRAVALKVVLPERDNQRTHDRFQREARVAGAMRHDGLVDVYDFGVDDTGRWFLVMELLIGVSLSKFVHSAGGVLGVDVACGVIRGVANALAAAHTTGLAHRDIKPDNIFCCDDDPPRAVPRTKIVDFGLAFIKDGGELGRLTADTVISGTPDFMAPEQCRGGADVTGAVDVYALGCVLMELLTGKPPFEGGQGELIAQHLHVPAPRLSTRLPGAPAALTLLVERMLAKDPAQRPSAADVEVALGEVMEGAPGLTDRAARAIAPHVATASAPRAAVVAAEAATTDLAPARPRVLVRGGIPPALVTALAVNGFDVAAGALDDDSAAAGAVEVVVSSAAADVARRVAAGAVVVAAADPDDLAAVSALVHAGAAEITPWPVDVADLAAKIVRAQKRAARKRGRP